MATLRRAGLRALSVDATRLDVVGNISYSLGLPVFEELVGADRIHGNKVTPGTPMMEFEARDSGDLDLAELLQSEGVTVTAELQNGKTVVLRNATQNGDGSSGTEEGTVSLRFVGLSAEEILAS